MSKTELKNDQTATYNAIIRLVEAGKTETKAFKKLTERLTWVNEQMEKSGWTGE